MLHAVSLTGYQQLLNWSSSLVGAGKISLSVKVPALLDRLKIEPSAWEMTLEELLKTGKKVVGYFGTTEQLNELATKCACRFLKNVTGRETELTTSKAS